MSRARTSFRYCALGLRLRSSLVLPELRADRGTRRADVVVEGARGAGARGGEVSVMCKPLADGAPWITCYAGADHYRIAFADCADFVISRSGDRISCRRVGRTPRETLRHLLLDQVMPLVVNVRGGEALHASAVRVGDGVCAFVAESGTGKSSLAAAFGARGFAVVADDCLTVRSGTRDVLAEGSYPGLRLWPDSAACLFPHLRRARRVAHYSDKIRVPVQGRSPAGPLRALYLLERDGSRGPVVARLSLRDAVMGLVGSAFRLDPTDRPMLARQLETLEQLARRVPVRRLRMPDDLSRIGRVADAVVADLDSRA